MNKLLVFIFAVLCLTGFTVNAGARAIQEKDALKASESNNFTDNVGKKWILTKVSINGKDTDFNRDELISMDNQGELFSLNFDGKGTLSGVGAPNRYSGPYTLSDKQTIKVQPMRSTLMASIFEPKGLKENDYYVYLQTAFKWARIDRRLEIHSKTGDDTVIMTFIFND